MFLSAYASALASVSQVPDSFMLNLVNNTGYTCTNYVPVQGQQFDSPAGIVNCTQATYNANNKDSVYLESDQYSPSNPNTLINSSKLTLNPDSTASMKIYSNYSPDYGASDYFYNLGYIYGDGTWHGAFFTQPLPLIYVVRNPKSKGDYLYIVNDPAKIANANKQ